MALPLHAWQLQVLGEPHKHHYGGEWHAAAPDGTYKNTLGLFAFGTFADYYAHRPAFANITADPSLARKLAVLTMISVCQRFEHGQVLETQLFHDLEHEYGLWRALADTPSLSMHDVRRCVVDEGIAELRLDEAAGVLHIGKCRVLRDTLPVGQSAPGVAAKRCLMQNAHEVLGLW